MIESYYAGAYWLARPEPAAVCARRAERFFQWLGRCDPAWTQWCQTASSFEEARKRHFITNAANFEELFAQEKNQVGDSFSFHLWTGENLHDTSGVDAACGSAEPWSRASLLTQANP